MVTLAKNEQKLRYWIKIAGGKRVMEDLLNDSGGGSTLDCHQEAHAIGRIAYELYGAQAFREGDASCHSGFYHGAMEAFLAQKGTEHLAKDIDEVCKNFATSFGRFECLHGVGHGVLAYEDYDLPEAIHTCDKLANEYERSSCYGGMFMENIVTAQGLGAKGGHHTTWASKDPQFPCNTIAQSYTVQYQCWQMQTSWMLTLANYNFDTVRDECVKVRPDMISVCFKSLGRDIAGHTLRNPQKISELCDKVPRENDYYTQCVIGAVNVIVDFWGAKLGGKGSELCYRLPQEGKKPCYETLTSRLNDVFNTPEERKKVCLTFEKDFQTLCTVL